MKDKSIHRLFLVGLLVVYQSLTFAQRETAIWYFGNNAGIDFNSGVPVALDDGQLVTGEGCATISTPSGQLLFYTDGISIFDRDHNLMPNGTGLIGDSSSTSSAIIVPDPGDTQRFYVFTVDTDDLVFASSQGLNYSVVDMSLNNGFGDVVPGEKNINLLPITSEKITAVQNTARDGFWIVSQFEDRFFAFELTAQGVNTTPVISVLPPFIELVDIPQFTNVDVAAMRGYLKSNKSGTKLAVAHFSNNTLSDFDTITGLVAARSFAYTNSGELYVYDFDKATGIVSNPIDLLEFDNGGSPYGLEFSPDERYLYVEIDYMTPLPNAIFNLIRGDVVQFDLQANDIAASMTPIFTSSINAQRGAIQAAFDGKLYHTTLFQTALSVIENPNVEAAQVTYNELNVDLLPGTLSRYGLPIFVPSFLIEAELLVNDICLGESISPQLDTDATIVNILWDFGEPGNPNNQSTDLQPTFTYTSTGTFTIEVQIETLVQNFSVFADIQVFPTPEIGSLNDITACNEGNNQAIFNFEANETSFNLGNGQNIAFFESLTDAELLQNAITNTNDYQNNDNPQVIYVRVDNEHCFEIDAFLLIVENCPPVIPNGFSPDGDGINDTFFIPDLRDVFPNFKLSIYNRYGVKVWEGDKNTEDWNGFSNTGLLNSTGLLPAGTYYYVLHFNDAQTKKKVGYVYMNY
ncbi:MAG: gliding motility-associated C-terminal domain-containing protein [Flavobacteriaceae bacterium]|nr:gliding motility-associated C-terminal domain-containing protein [Flavobacteriaceae bacterium]